MVQKLDNRLVLLEMLNDLKFHDGSQLGQRLNMSRQGVWKMLQKIQAQGIELESCKGRGYRFKHPLYLLSQKKIVQDLNWLSQDVVVLESVDSSNRYLNKIDPKPKLVLAEAQSDGRGRMGRRWYSPFAQNIYMSLHYTFQKEVSLMHGVSLACAVSVIKALKQILPHDKDKLVIKWPNDILYQNKKLAGILIDLQADANGSCEVIIGIGLNVNMQTAPSALIRYPWCSLAHIAGNVLDRNAVAVTLVRQLMSDMQLYQQQGFEPFCKAYDQYDALQGTLVTLKHHQQACKGIARGINEYGHLILDIKGVSKAFASGMVRNS